MMPKPMTLHKEDLLDSRASANQSNINNEYETRSQFELVHNSLMDALAGIVKFSAVTKN